MEPDPEFASDPRVRPGLIDMTACCEARDRPWSEDAIGRLGIADPGTAANATRSGHAMAARGTAALGGHGPYAGIGVMTTGVAGSTVAIPFAAVAPRVSRHG